MPTPTNKKLYQDVKEIADSKFLAPTSVYKSAWIVAEYKRRGGLYKEDGERKGLTQWFKEKWVDLSRPIKNKSGEYEKCGRANATTQGKYPLCRPSKRVNKDTPMTVSEIKNTKSLTKIKEEKQKIKEKGRVQFGK